MDTDNLNDEKVSEQTEILKQDLPTIFELNAHDHFHSLIQPALKHIVKVTLKILILNDGSFFLQIIASFRIQKF